MRDIFAANDLRENNIFNSLPPENYQRLLPHLETVNLPTNQNIYNYGDEMPYVYFPLDAVVYLFLTMENGATVEAGIVGCEGVLGVSVFMGAKTAFNQAKVLAPNRALRVKSEIIKQEFDRGGDFHKLVLNYTHAYCVQITQTAACNRIHQMESRLCRWLLLMHDRMKSDKLAVTQEFISHMLGTRRPYITAAVGLLQKENIVKCSRGHIQILDREALEKCACECYSVIQDEFNHLYKKAH